MERALAKIRMSEKIINNLGNRKRVPPPPRRAPVKRREPTAVKRAAPRAAAPKPKKPKPADGVQPFVQKLYEIVSSESEYPFIYWGEYGEYFVIEREAFDEGFLQRPKAEKAPIQTKEFASFIRQLNLYGFRKRNEEEGSDPNNVSFYLHQYGFFQRAKPELLKWILRNGSAKAIELAEEVREQRRRVAEEEKAQAQHSFRGQKQLNQPPNPADRMPTRQFELEAPPAAEEYILTESTTHNQEYFHHDGMNNQQWVQPPSWEIQQYDHQNIQPQFHPITPGMGMQSQVPITDFPLLSGQMTVVQPILNSRGEQTAYFEAVKLEESNSNNEAPSTSSTVPQFQNFETPSTSAQFQASTTGAYFQAPSTSAHFDAPSSSAHFDAPPAASSFAAPQFPNFEAPSTSAHWQAPSSSAHWQAPSSSAHWQAPSTSAHFHAPPASSTSTAPQFPLKQEVITDQQYVDINEWLNTLPDKNPEPVNIGEEAENNPPKNNDLFDF